MFTIASPNLSFETYHLASSNLLELKLKALGKSTEGDSFDQNKQLSFHKRRANVTYSITYLYLKFKTEVRTMFSTALVLLLLAITSRLVISAPFMQKLLTFDNCGK